MVINPMLPQFNHLILLIEKTLFVLGSIIYFVFSVVIVKQTTMMSKNVSDILNSFLVIFAYLHLIFAIFLVILTLVVL